MVACALDAYTFTIEPGEVSCSILARGVLVVYKRIWKRVAKDIHCEAEVANLGVKPKVIKS